MLQLPQDISLGQFLGFGALVALIVALMAWVGLSE
jgi:hypothetical protein